MKKGRKEKMEVKSYAKKTLLSIRGRCCEPRTARLDLAAGPVMMNKHLQLQMHLSHQHLSPSVPEPSEENANQTDPVNCLIEFSISINPR